MRIVLPTVQTTGEEKDEVQLNSTRQNLTLYIELEEINPVIDETPSKGLPIFRIEVLPPIGCTGTTGPHI